MAVGDTYTVYIDGMPVHVTCKNVKNINFRIDSKGQALMSVPPHVTRQRAEEVALRHREWFQKHAHAGKDRHEQGQHRWTSGESVYVWGERCTLRVEKTGDGPMCKRDGSELVISVPQNATAQYCEAVLERWYQQELMERLKSLLPECEKRIGVHATHVTIRRMKSRWGSCTHSTARIRINTALAECPPACTEMVLVHELCHLIEANHGPRFKALMDLHCPDWRVTKRWLDMHPPRA